MDKEGRRVTPLLPNYSKNAVKFYVPSIVGPVSQGQGKADYLRLILENRLPRLCRLNRSISQNDQSTLIQRQDDRPASEKQSV